MGFSSVERSARVNVAKWQVTRCDAGPQLYEHQLAFNTISVSQPHPVVIFQEWRRQAYVLMPSDILQLSVINEINVVSLDNQNHEYMGNK